MRPAINIACAVIGFGLLCVLLWKEPLLMLLLAMSVAGFVGSWM